MNIHGSIIYIHKQLSIINNNKKDKLIENIFT